MAPWNNAAPDCIQHGLQGGLPYSAEIAAPFEKCVGFFTFGPGRAWEGAAGHPVAEGGHVGQVVYNASAGLYTLTAIGFLVSIAAFVAWVWTEHRKLTARAAELRAGRPGPAEP